ncbi:MAG: hypothetical protein ACJAYC_000238 [Halieaceae bacterium]
MSNRIRSDTRQPVLIVGAGRSGTSFLSRALGEDPIFWNSYENRYVWNYGQKDMSHDYRARSEASAKTGKYIKSHFAKLANRVNAIVVDKTPSNAYRLEFIHEIFPDIKIIHLIRDGRDNIASRRLEWFGGRAVLADESGEKAKGYLIKLIARRLDHAVALVRRGNLPFDRIPVFLKDNIPQFFRHIYSGEPSRYGERFHEMERFKRENGLLPTAARQWQGTVEIAMRSGGNLPSSTYKEVKFEDMVQQPSIFWGELSEFIEVQYESPVLKWLEENADDSIIGKWKARLTQKEVDLVSPYMQDLMETLGYGWSEI